MKAQHKGNILIHKFRGYKRMEDTSNFTDDRAEAWYVNKNKSNDITQGVPEYHKDWNMLMLAVDKIEHQSFDVSIKGYGSENCDHVCQILDADIREVAIHHSNSKIDAVWNAVVQFCTPVSSLPNHNQNKK